MHFPDTAEMDKAAIRHLTRLADQVDEIAAQERQPLAARVERHAKPFPRMVVSDGSASLGVVVGVYSFFTESRDAALGSVDECAEVAAGILARFTERGQ